jgi:hypothetical protein
VLRAGEDRRALRAGPLERLLDLGTRGVRQLCRLVARLLEQPAPLGLRLLELAGGVGVGLRQKVAGLVPGRVQQLGALPLALDAVPLDLRLAPLEILLAPADLFLRLAELGGGCVLGVALDRVGELGGGADQVQRVHADGVARRLDVRATARSLDDPELCLQLRRVTAEGVEGLANPVRVEPVPASRDVLELRQGRQRRDARPARVIGCHSVRSPPCLRVDARRAQAEV